MQRRVQRGVGDVAVDGVELRGLRERCYCRAASAETVAVYLAALERCCAAGADPPSMRLADDDARPATRRREQHLSRPVGTAWAGAAAVALAAALTGLHPGPPTADRPAPAAAPARAAFAAPPAPGDVLAGFGSDGDWTTGPLDAGGRTVVLSGLCRGEGTYDVRIGAEPPVTLVCDRGGPAFAMLASARPLHAFRVTVTPTPGQRSPQWVFSVGTMPAGGR